MSISLGNEPRQHGSPPPLCPDVFGVLGLYRCGGVRLLRWFHRYAKCWIGRGEGRPPPPGGGRDRPTRGRPDEGRLIVIVIVA